VPELDHIGIGGCAQDGSCNNLVAEFGPVLGRPIEQIPIFGPSPDIEIAFPLSNLGGVPWSESECYRKSLRFWPDESRTISLILFVIREIEVIRQWREAQLPAYVRFEIVRWGGPAIFPNDNAFYGDNPAGSIPDLKLLELPNKDIGALASNGDSSLSCRSVGVFLRYAERLRDFPDVFIPFNLGVGQSFPHNTELALAGEPKCQSEACNCEGGEGAKSNPDGLNLENDKICDACGSAVVGDQSAKYAYEFFGAVIIGGILLACIFYTAGRERGEPYSEETQDKETKSSSGSVAD